MNSTAGDKNRFWIITYNHKKIEESLGGKTNDSSGKPNRTKLN